MSSRGGGQQDACHWGVGGGGGGSVVRVQEVGDSGMLGVGWGGSLVRVQKVGDKGMQVTGRTHWCAGVAA